MSRADFAYQLKQRVWIIEGSLGSELQVRIGTPGVFLPHLVAEKPELIARLHREYGQAGANIQVSATAGANRLTLAREHMQDGMEELNRRAVALTRENLGNGALLFAGLGPTDALLKPYGTLVEDDYREIFAEQARYLLDAGVDGFILEGFSSLIEAEQCLVGLRQLCASPVIATMTFLEDGNTKFGDSMADCFQVLLECGADAVGIHGTLGPLEIDGFLERLEGSYPLCVRPNAGYPVRVGKVTTYLSSPEYVAECAELFAEKGAVIVGGAAGFSPGHIEAVANRLRGFRPSFPGDEGNRVVLVGSSGEEPGTRTTGSGRLAEKLGHKPVISVELEPPRGLEIEPVIQLLQRLEPLGVDAVNIPENPLARARISSIAMAKAIHERTGIESIAHLTCRDRNLISLQAELLGAHVMGVHTILALTGDPSGVGDYPTATSVFDVNSLGLVEIMARMNIGKDFGMNDLGAHTNFNIGIAANPFAADMKTELARIEKKLEGGATFIQTQPIFDAEAVKPFLRQIAPFKVPVLFGVMIIRDYRHAKFLANEYPGIKIRESDLKRFEHADKDDRETSVSFAAELVRDMAGMSGGVYLMPGFGDADCLVDVFQRLDLDKS